MYDLRFDEAHRVFDQWRGSHPDDCLAPASDAAAYLFSELARLGSLEAELFVSDTRFSNRKKLSPDPGVKLHFTQRINEADRLAEVGLGKSSADTNALFVKSLIFGLRANYAGLIEKRNFAALSYTKQGHPFAERLLSIDPSASDAYLGPGVENYLLSLEPAPLRVLLRWTGSKTDRDKGMEELRKTALHGYYLEPFAKLLLVVAALRDNNPGRRPFFSGSCAIGSRITSSMLSSWLSLRTRNNDSHARLAPIFRRDRSYSKTLRSPVWIVSPLLGRTSSPRLLG